MPQHDVGKIGSDDVSRRLSPGPAQGKCHVPSATAEIKYSRLGTPNDVLKLVCCTAPPQPVYVQRENVIQQVIARRDRGKHLAHGPRRGIWIPRAFRSSAYDWIFGFGHDSEAHR